MGGSAKRMANFAKLVAREIGHPTVDLEELSMTRTDRYNFYKIGPVISVNVRMCTKCVCLLSLVARMCLCVCVREWV